MFKLRFDRNEIGYWATRYPVADDEEVEHRIAPAVRDRVYLTKPEFLTICRWKTPRSKPRVARNPEEFIEEVTQTAFSASEDRLRIEVLTLLEGVGWPTASVLLHFCHQDRFPILDFRALWSLGVNPPPAFYRYDFWKEYTNFCRELAAEAGVTMRVLDRALWQYSDDNQKSK